MDKPQLSWSQPITTPPSEPQKPKHSEKHTEPAKSGAKRTTFRTAVIVVLLIAAVGIVASVITAQNKHTTVAGDVSGASPADTNSSALSATTENPSDASLSIPSPQSAGLHVSVAHISATEPTWVVVYENRGGLPGNVLGAGLFTSERTSGTVDLLRGTLPGQSYFIGESRDDGDHMYSVINDPAVRDADGDPLLVEFKTR